MAALFSDEGSYGSRRWKRLYDLGAVIVDFAGDLSTCRAVMQTLCHF